MHRHRLRRWILGVSTVALAFSGCQASEPTPAKIAAAETGARGSCPDPASPFGNPPRPISSLNAGFQPICVSGGQSLFGFTDSDGTPRMACLYAPARPASDKLPLLVFLHPSFVGPDLSSAFTMLRGFIDTANLSGDATKPGFLLLEPAGRIINDRPYPIPDQNNTPGWDNWYRQLSLNPVVVGGKTYAPNVDAATIDHYIQEAIRQGHVDEKRIYITGWSNGSSMGVLYALNRPNIAAAAVYSAPDPFDAFSDPCPQTPVAGAAASSAQIEVSNPMLPLYHIHNNCDIAGTCPNARYLASTLASGGAAPVRDVIIDASQARVSACLDVCGTDPTASEISLVGDTLGSLNHLRWPDQWTEAMFAFLRAHSLP